jgi:hypothetical protein
MANTKTKNRPTHRIYAVAKSGETEKAQWREIGAAWPHKDGKGFNLKLDLVPLNGAEIVIRTIDEKSADHAQGGAA